LDNLKTRLHWFTLVLEYLIGDNKDHGID
jgi:hypothetical protein